MALLDQYDPNGDNELVISVCYHSTEMLPDFIEHTQRKGINVPNKYELILRLIYSSAVWFLKYLKQINNEVNNAEKELERSIRNEDLLRLMNLQKSLVYFNTSIRGNLVVACLFAYRDSCENFNVFLNSSLFMYSLQSCKFFCCFWR